jgi:tripartite-type tricarboxylate transporter receptor subunit TctC/phenylpropionate dioxygenase-like ring-hydroxylating dioxygenase large terminal subunit
MLSAENNELLCRVGLGTPMGELMRQYWVPALPSSEFPGPDCLPKRMRLLGENMVMFRDSQGRMGALEEYCPHRGASLYFGRNEEGGIRCSYHGWKFDITGACLDTPTEQPERREAFCAKIKARAYPCHEVNHMVWVYMGSRKEPPPFPAFEVNTLPDDHIARPLLMMEEASWLQNMEGDLDSAHLDWVHRRLKEDSPKPEKGIRGFWNPSGRPPVIDVVPTDYGAFYSGIRTLPDGDGWHRVGQFIFPFHTMITMGDGRVNLKSWVPVDDNHTLQIIQRGHPTQRLSEEGKLVTRAKNSRVHLQHARKGRSHKDRNTMTQGPAKRRSVLTLTTAFIGSAMMGLRSVSAVAQAALPKGPIRLLVGYSAGGSADVLARLIAQKLGERTGLTTLVENKPGAGGVIATEMVVNAPPDGSTIVLANMASTIMATLTYPKLQYDPQKDLAPVSLVCTGQHALTVATSVPVTDPAQLSVWAKANPEKMNFGVPAVGGQAHFFVLAMGKALGVEVQVVPYRGTTQMISDLSGGQLFVGISGVADFQASHRAGKVRIIATSGKERSLSTPDIPTFAESGFPTLAGEHWFGIYAPAKTPQPTVAALSAEIQAIMKLPDIRERLIQLSLDPRGTSPAGLAEFDENEFQRWQPIVAASGFKLE